MVEEEKLVGYEHVEKGTVQETMLGPVWARAKFSQKYPELLNDPNAVDIIEHIDHDFSDTEKLLDGKGEFRSMGLLVRAKSFDQALLNYMELHPECIVVNIGAGLDTTFSRVDNSKIKWYDLALPNGAEFRRKLIHETPRSKIIAKDALDLSWFDDIEYDPEKGIFFIAGGFIYYFKEPQLKMLFKAMVERFPGGEIVFDAISPLAIKILRRLAKKNADMGDVDIYFGIKRPEKVFPSWSNKIEVKDSFVIWSRVDINSNWDKQVKKMIKLAKLFKTARIVLLKFNY